jgi:hypothetical protein
MHTEYQENQSLEQVFFVVVFILHHYAIVMSPEEMEKNEIFSPK